MDNPFQAYTSNVAYVFVCYSYADSELVYPELGWLRQQEINIWCDEGIPAGKNWRSVGQNDQ